VWPYAWSRGGGGDGPPAEEKRYIKNPGRREDTERAGGAEGVGGGEGGGLFKADEVNEEDPERDRATRCR